MVWPFQVLSCIEAIMGDFSIQISADLVNRLVDDGSKSKKKAKKSKPKVPQAKAREKQLPDHSVTNMVAAPTGWPVQPPLFLPVNPPVEYSSTELDAIKSVLQESERVLEKLQMQEDKMLQEVTERAKDLHDKEFKLPYQKPMPCLADYDACKQCYNDYSHDILKCGPLARSYYDCVRKAKQEHNSASR